MRLRKYWDHASPSVILITQLSTIIRTVDSLCGYISSFYKFVENCSGTKNQNNTFKSLRRRANEQFLIFGATILDKVRSEQMCV